METVDVVLEELEVFLEQGHVEEVSQVTSLILSRKEDVFLGPKVNRQPYLFM